MKRRCLKFFVLGIFALLCATVLWRVKLGQSTTYLAPQFYFYNEFELDKDYGFNEKDKTIFEFKYKTKIWEYNVAENFVENKTYDINYELNKYKFKNNKNIKINTIKKLKKLNTENELIINYLFPKIDNELKIIKNNIEKPCFNANFKYSIKNNKINIEKEKIGIKINFDLLYSQIIDEYIKTNHVVINIPTEEIMPEIFSSELEKSSNLRASFSTSFASSNSDRKHNIRQAVKKINGQVVDIGQSFSFNNIVGRRSEENGYRVAKIISNGEFVDGVGGGVCQVSTTLYNTALLAGLKIQQANKHSERIYYCKAGFDAMVNYGSSDLVFSNNTNQPIRIYGHCDNDRVYFSIFGEKLGGYSYKLRSEIIDEVPAGVDEVVIDNEKKYIDKVEFADESFELKKAKNGCTIKSYREVYSYGNLVRVEELRTDKYLPQHAVIVYGARLRPIEIDIKDILN